MWAEISADIIPAWGICFIKLTTQKIQKNYSKNTFFHLIISIFITHHHFSVFPEK